MRINSREDLEEYLNHEKIMCLECGKRFVFLPPHLSRSHQMTAIEYRDAYNIPAGAPLAGIEYRKKQSDKMKKMIGRGEIDYEHLPRAVEASLGSERASRRDYDIERQREIARNIERQQLPPGSKLASGKDADKAREYQRKYRAKNK